MIKSYKIILIVQFFVLAVSGFVFYTVEYGIDFAIIPKWSLLVIGSSFLLALGISILIQRLIISILQSDSEVDLENSNEDKFWQISFFANLAFGTIVFLSSVICVIMSFGIGIKGFSGFGIRLSIFLGILFIASLVVGLFFRIKDSVNEVSGLLGGLMMLLSAVVFGGSLYFGLNQLISPQYSSSEIIKAMPFVPEVDETQVSRDSAYAVIDTTMVDSASTFGQEEITDEQFPDEEDDYYGLKKMNSAAVKSTGYFKEYFDESYTDTRVQKLIRYFLADFLNLKKDSYSIDTKNKSEPGFHPGEYLQINDVGRALRGNPDALTKSFKSYSPIIYSLLSKKIYFESNLNQLVDVLIASRDDVSNTGDASKTMSEIYKTMISGPKKDIASYNYNQIVPYVSKANLDLIREKAYAIGGNSDKAATIIVYSFWARRYHDGNDAVVYDILKEIKTHYDKGNKN
ncbi:hypothetical protein C8C83_2269 [Flavobacterium sp. 90]|uniref:hypothetical protein n=1 Tax=unclassified Flavobacterium TaxID=196869 RepID=UPI000EAFADEF|nr:MULTISPECIES: hypothetical protein [unclassified Flavobacterium]RKR10593.1 hypothetical protein C8C82_2574 [Flavobacterium sp. 81]TCK54376.1 hypothetical protein C8C83_2269 [Flavobacterium sp. 90]